MWVVEDENGNQNYIPFSDGNRILVNDPINEFLGTVSNLWSNPLNWSLGFLPTADQTAIISADCVQNASPTVNKLVINEGNTLTISTGITIFGLENKGLITSTGEYNLTIMGVSANYVMFGNINRGLVLRNHVIGTMDLTNVINKFNVYNELSDDGGIYNRILPKDVTASMVVHSRTTQVILEFPPGDCSIIADLIQFSTSRKVKFNGTLLLKPTGATGDLAWSGVDLVGSSGTITIELDNKLFAYKYAAGFSGANSILNVSGNSSIALQGNGTSVSLNIINIKKNSKLEAFNAHPVESPPLYILNTITGEDNTSELHVKATISFRFNSVPMDVGMLFADYDRSIILYDMAGNQDIKVPADRYRELRLQGSGVKKITGHITCEHLYFAGTATLDLNGYSLTCPKYTDTGSPNRNLPSGIFDEMTISATSGNKTLTGDITVNTFIKTGNSVILYNGFTINAVVFNQTYTGTDLNLIGRKYTNLTLQGSGPVYVLSGNLIVTDTFTNEGGGSINMSAYSIDFTTCTAVYNRNSGQNVFPGTYKNLTLSGSGIKTLQGNVIVTGTYQRTGTATINKNGFTIKNGSGVDLE